MKRKLVQILIFILVIGESYSQQNIIIDINIQYQTMHGFGASDAWNFDYVGKYWSSSVKENITEKLFSKALDEDENPVGIGLSRWRFNVGAGSAEQGAASNIDMEERRVECFLNEDSSYNWEKQAGQQWFLQKAADYGVEELVAFLNSPPRFYTKNGRANSDNTYRGGPTNLKDDHYDDYADFITTVLKHFKDSGITFAQVSPVNEPQYEWNSGQEGCPWQNMEIKTLVGELDAAIREKGLETKILIAEAGSYDDLHQVNGPAETSDQIWRFFNSENPEYLGDYSQMLPGICGHSYWTDGDDAAIRSARQNINREAKEQGNIQLYQTEYNLLSNHYDNKLLNSIFLGKMIYADLAIAGVSIWDYWTAIERERWDQLNRFYLIRLIPDGGDYADLTSEGTITTDKNLWVLGNFSRFIRPGYRRINVSGAIDLNGLMAAGFISQDTSELVIVYVNWGITAKSVTHSLSNWSDGNTFVSMVPYLTNSIYSLTKRDTISGEEEYTIPPRSVVTLVAGLNDDNLTFTSINELDYRDVFNVYPNPTDGVFTISNEGAYIRNHPLFQLFDATGSLMFSGKIEGEKYICHALQKKQNGLYFIKIGNRVEKVLKIE
jgi:O-glycosyl hydrolase